MRIVVCSGWLRLERSVGSRGGGGELEGMEVGKDRVALGHLCIQNFTLKL